MAVSTSSPIDSFPEDVSVRACSLWDSAMAQDNLQGYTLARAVRHPCSSRPPKKKEGFHLMLYCPKILASKPIKRASNIVVGFGAHWPSGPCMKVGVLQSGPCRIQWIRLDIHMHHFSSDSGLPFGCSMDAEPPCI